MTNDRKLLYDFEPFQGIVELADKTTVPIKGRGSTKFPISDTDHIESKVLYIPDLEKNL